MIQETGIVQQVKRLIPIALFLLSCTASAAPQKPAYTPKTGSSERRQILDALRSPVEANLGKKVIFKVDHLKVHGEWAFMRGIPQKPSGEEMDYKGTPYEQSIVDGMFDDWICALLRKRGSRWGVVEYVIGATDVAYEGWDRKHKAPGVIFE